MTYHIDGLQYCLWSKKIFSQMAEGKINAVHVTICYHENFRETISNLVQWNKWFEIYSSLIFHGRWASDIGLIEVWHQLGIRFMQLTYNNQSLFATGCSEEKDLGVTRMGNKGNE